jgi:lipopolysaccharide biosynthesis glycosyltransferase
MHCIAKTVIIAFKKLSRGHQETCRENFNSGVTSENIERWLQIVLSHDITRFRSKMELAYARQKQDLVAAGVGNRRYFL